MYFFFFFAIFYKFCVNEKKKRVHIFKSNQSHILIIIIIAYSHNFKPLILANDFLFLNYIIIRLLL